MYIRYILYILYIYIRSSPPTDEMIDQTKYPAAKYYSFHPNLVDIRHQGSIISRRSLNTLEQHGELMMCHLLRHRHLECLNPEKEHVNGNWKLKRCVDT